ncbi:hypothetical protein PP997_gp30 [Gordonia phage BigChungus]|uniref:Uncharacterized protein n=1 Tax=Gordonia phage BigChungus TaxID=2762389 RepID=A0A7G8LQK8_9CAUD|nr:hypothetical protein PP997_gp30 [Gordonia phage BigChungus]QNJ59390.1 hypothetical protein SEA_FEASTONYEET_30 [Gordonia phage Feastonyeet]QNJ59530.1 hypothetical protein SEA_BIGCHUNGUS_30 [Gordonia phage BigChungus]UXE03273.1 hypothetical protein SEA_SUMMITACADEMY_31 [Gordonia phage SummitAcademy]
MNTAYPHLALVERNADDLRASAKQYRRAGDHNIADALETIANRTARQEQDNAR